MVGGFGGSAQISEQQAGGAGGAEAEGLGQEGSQQRDYSEAPQHGQQNVGPRRGGEERLHECCGEIHLQAAHL